MRRLVLCAILCMSSVWGASSHAEDPITPWGCDCDLVTMPKSAPKTSISPPVMCCNAMIRFFQQHISPIDGVRSSFLPTSSEYTRQSIQKYGVLQGIALGCDRLLRENKGQWIYRPLKGDPYNRRFDPVR